MVFYAGVEIFKVWKWQGKNKKEVKGLKERWNAIYLLQRYQTQEAMEKKLKYLFWTLNNLIILNNKEKTKNSLNMK